MDKTSSSEEVSLEVIFNEIKEKGGYLGEKNKDKRTRGNSAKQKRN